MTEMEEEQDEDQLVHRAAELERQSEELTTKVKVSNQWLYLKLICHLKWFYWGQGHFKEVLSVSRLFAVILSESKVILSGLFSVNISPC